METKKAILKTKKYLTKKTIYFDFEMISPKKFEFIPGQYINCAVAENIRRSYSIGSPSYQNNHFELFIDISPGGPGSNFFISIDEGHELEFLAPLGMFKLEEGKAENMLFIATGTGIAPIRSMYLDLLHRNFQGKINLLFGLRYIEDLFLVDELEGLSRENRNFKFEMILSRPESKTWVGEIGHVQDLINKLEIDFTKTDTYICGGNQKMIFDVSNILKQKGSSPDLIHFEKFY